MQADMKDYPVPIDVNQQAATIEVGQAIPPLLSLTPTSPSARFCSHRSRRRMALGL